MKLLALGTAIASLLVAPAMAADMPVKAPVTRMAAPSFSWTGCYVGGSAGYNQHRTKWTDIDEYWLIGGPPNTTAKVNSTGAIFGLDAGCNLQTGSFVLGVETDISWSTAQKTVTLPLPSDPTWLAYLNTKASWIGTTRLRAGFALDRTLIYATGGLAYSKSRAHWTENAHPGAVNEWDLKDWRWGYAIGGGIEYAVSNSWTVRAEALYLQYGSDLADPVSGSRFQMRTKSSDLIARVGLNYLFGTAAPVIARY